MSVCSSYIYVIRTYFILHNKYAEIIVGSEFNRLYTFVCSLTLLNIAVGCFTAQGLLVRRSQQQNNKGGKRKEKWFPFFPAKPVLT